MCCLIMSTSTEKIWEGWRLCRRGMKCGAMGCCCEGGMEALYNIPKKMAATLAIPPYSQKTAPALIYKCSRDKGSLDGKQKENGGKKPCVEN